MAGLIYTANFGGYDRPLRPPETEDGINYLNISEDEWSLPDEPPLVRARHAKVMAPFFYPHYEWYLWLDHTMEVKAPLKPLIDSLLGGPHDFAAFKHNEWDCAYKEIDACIERGKDDPSNLLQARFLLKDRKYPRHYGQAATGVLWRRNTNQIFHHALWWWETLKETTMRDQATFMLGLRRMGAFLTWIPGLHTHNEWFKFHQGHKR